MNPFITCANNFSPSDTRQEIRNHRDSRNCLDIEDPGPPGTTLFFDDFESGGFTSGGWVLADTRPKVIESSSRNGTFGAKVKLTTWAERAVSTVGFDSVEVKYWRRTKRLDSGEMLFVEWWDGGSWNLIEQTSSESWARSSVTLPASAANNADFKIRFRSNASQANEKGDFDDVEVVGFGDPPPQTTLFSDDFESGGFGAGGWVLADTRPKVIESSARNGTFGAKVKLTTWVERAIDTSGFATIQFNYWRRTLRMESGEELFVEWWDGSAWILVESTNATNWVNQSFTLPAAAGNNPDFKIRFRSIASQANEKGDFDDVEVLGS
jgi:hypothetical protein